MVFDFRIFAGMMKNNYNRYHSTVKSSFALGIQSQVLPETFIRSIPRTTSQNWKDLNPDKFVGSEFASSVENDLEKVKVILDQKVRKMTNAFYAFCRLYLTILKFIGNKMYS